MSVGQACNLRCKNCANFSPYATNEMRKYSLESIISDLEIMFNSADVDLLQIQGGEPLIYKELTKLLGYLSACREVQQIHVATNGMLTPSDEIMLICSMNKIFLRVSNYPQNKDNLQNIAGKCRSFRVSASLYDFSSREALWYDCGGLDVPRENDDRIVSERFQRCGFKGCLTLEDGELHRCSRAKNAYKLQGFEPEAGDCVRVRGNKNFLDDLVAYHSPPRFETACRYCNGTHNVKKIPAAEQL